MILKKRDRGQPRFGLTLVELLVVVGVVSVLAAIILPSVKTVLTDRKSSQSAILVRNFLEAARARAIGKNRTVAVVLERLSSRAFFDLSANNGNGAYVSETATYAMTSVDTNFVPYNACIRLSLAEEPLPVSDGMMSLPVEMFPRSPNDPFPNAQFPTAPSFPGEVAGQYEGADALVDSHQLGGLNEVRTFRVTSPSGDVSRLLAEYLVAGSEISFGTSTRRFTIVSPRNPRAHQNHYANAGDNSIWFSVINEIAGEDLGERASMPYEPLRPFEKDPNNPGISGISRFKIYGRPKPIYSEMVSLPRGMCIDLSLSGFANDGLRNSVTNPLNQPVIDPTAGPIDIPLSDYRVRFASDWISNSSTPPLPNELRPVFVSFTPDGNLSHVWANERQGSNLVRIDASQDIFLHIGKIDQIVMPVDPGIGARNKAAYDATVAAGVRQNLSDLNSYVVRLSPKSGTITASPAVSVDTQIGILGLNPSAISLGDLIELSRRGTYSTNVTAQ